MMYEPELSSLFWKLGCLSLRTGKKYQPLSECPRPWMVCIQSMPVCTHAFPHSVNRFLLSALWKCRGTSILIGNSLRNSWWVPKPTSTEWWSSFSCRVALWLIPVPTKCWVLIQFFSDQNVMSTRFDEFWSRAVLRYDCTYKQKFLPGKSRSMSEEQVKKKKHKERNHSFQAIMGTGKLGKAHLPPQLVSLLQHTFNSAAAQARPFTSAQLSFLISRFFFLISDFPELPNAVLGCLWRTVAPSNPRWS